MAMVSIDAFAMEVRITRTEPANQNYVVEYIARLKVFSMVWKTSI